MNDTDEEFSRVVAERHRSMSPMERWLAASSLFETARAIVASSLPGDLTAAERRLAIARRIYGAELPEAALLAHANYIRPPRD